MTPVSIALLAAGLAISAAVLYLAATRGPALVADGLATVLATVLRIRTVRANAVLLGLERPADADPWAKPSRDQRRALSRSLKLAMSTTTLASVFPAQIVRGHELAERLGYA